MHKRSSECAHGRRDMKLPPEADRRRDKNTRIRHGYTSLRVTNATARLVVAVAESIDALSLDEALFYLTMHELGLERARRVLEGAPRPAVARGVVDLHSSPNLAR